MYSYKREIMFSLLKTVKSYKREELVFPLKNADIHFYKREASITVRLYCISREERMRLS